MIFPHRSHAVPSSGHETSSSSKGRFDFWAIIAIFAVFLILPFFMLFDGSAEPKKDFGNGVFDIIAYDEHGELFYYANTLSKVSYTKDAVKHDGDTIVPVTESNHVIVFPSETCEGEHSKTMSFFDSSQSYNTHFTGNTKHDLCNPKDIPKKLTYHTEMNLPYDIVVADKEQSYQPQDSHSALFKTNSSGANIMVNNVDAISIDDSTHQGQYDDDMVYTFTSEGEPLNKYAYKNTRAGSLYDGTHTTDGMAFVLSRKHYWVTTSGKAPTVKTREDATTKVVAVTDEGRTMTTFFGTSAHYDGDDVKTVMMDGATIESNGKLVISNTGTK